MSTTNASHVLSCFPTQAKRFGLEGCESMIPGLEAMLDRSYELGVRNCVIGMPHRGRLNVLCNVMQKDTALIFKEFEGAPIDGVEAHTQIMQKEDFVMSGDVKYHLGTSSRREYADGGSIHLSLVANPSHLEAVNPVVMGKARAKMYVRLAAR